MDPQKAGRPLPPSVSKIGRHAAYADLNHDDIARLNFVQMAFFHVATNMFPGNQKVWENRVKPAFVRDHNRAPNAAGGWQGHAARSPLADVELAQAQQSGDDV